MQESKISATHRLQKEGRWEEASRFRDDARNRCRSEGLNKKEAAAKAWEKMIEEFPPRPTPEPAIANNLKDAQTIAELKATDKELRELLQNTPQEFAADALWAYSHLSVQDVGASEAPSAGSWGLLQWARSNQDKFFSQVIPKAQALADAALNDDDLAEDAREELLSIQALNEEIGRLGTPLEEKLASDLDSAIRQEIQSCVIDFVVRAGVPFKRNESRRLETEIACLVQRCIEVGSGG